MRCLWNRNRNRNKFINQIRAPGGHIQITIIHNNNTNNNYDWYTTTIYQPKYSRWNINNCGAGVIEPFFPHSQFSHFWSTISVDGFTSQVACTWMIQMTLNGLSQKQKTGHLMGHYMIPHHVLHIFSLETAITFEPIIRSN